MRTIVRTILIVVGLAAAGAAAAHPGHATLGPLAGALHLHAIDIALALLAVGVLAIAAPGAWQRLSAGRPPLARWIASRRALAFGCTLAAAALLLLAV